MITILICKANGILYIDFLNCFNQNCFELEQRCKSDVSCNIQWMQFQICANKSQTVKKFQNCQKQYLKNLEEDSILFQLSTCYQICQGNNLYKCNLHLQEYQSCKQNFECANQYFQIYEENVQICMKERVSPCEQQELEKQKCYNSQMLGCISQFSNLSIKQDLLYNCVLENNSNNYILSIQFLSVLLLFVFC
ncbi:hypothetical protein ABPG74_007169 [Tetrahymena malaccensis]